MAAQLINDGPTTTTSLADDLHAVAEILLRLPSPAALVRAALASRRWRQVASSPGFLRRYRSRHTSSPLLGLYVPRSHAGLPSFQLADSVRSDRALAKFVRAGDFNLTGLGSHPEWRLLDCHNSRLLLSRGESRAVYNPVSGREPLWLPLPQNSPLEGTFISECLLQGHSDDAASFRVVSVQHRGRDQMVRAAEYDSCTRQWHRHQWVMNINRPQHEQAMHAGRLIFWRYEDTSLLLLDTATVEFSILGLPFPFFQLSMYAIGDTVNGVCCLVGLVGSINNLHLQVWLLKEDGVTKTWEPENKVPVSQVFGRDAQLNQVHVVTNGVALLGGGRCHQFAINLKKMCIDAEFECSALGYPLQMPWPPAVLVETGSETINFIGDVVTKNLSAIEETEMNMMVGIQCDKMVHKSKTIPTSRLDLVGDMIPYNQMVVHGSEMVQGIQTTQGNDPAESVVRTKSRYGSEMVSSDHGGQMINSKQNVICGSEMVQGIEMTHDNGTAEVTTASRCSNMMDHSDEMIHCNQMVIRDSEMVHSIEMTRGTYTVEAAPTTSRHGHEMVPGRKMVHGCSVIRCNQIAIHDKQIVQGIEMPHGNDTAEAAPDAPPTTARRRRKNSIIWEHFTTETNSDGCTRACCNYCKRTFACSKTAGTSHLKRHITLGSCPVVKSQVPPSSGRTGNRGSCAAGKPSKRQCIHAGPGNNTFNRNGNTSYLGNMDILTEPLATKQGNEYSISKCLKVLHDMDNVSDEIKHLAFHVLKDATNREIFMSYESRLRGLWLKKEVTKL
ncbi:hypothetical protein PAHAL_5G316700 [Panicum hallii]|uniref:BED-type domain-containing protein n=1 Tax=Panicum hallii TaxID=206008 RepID=A0A2T8ILW9_9POAL|nr:uncharacterized protein LOC112893791 isoform X2 [Panicum hallii]PVH38649.1 hypothetical protein PAHAL_5G316700 [Panicum hallii]PVH38650.1 hypothetical protein PAHAL_5G316700 [Panicum hallii]PVH38652.1 hypothetical protein PAHAL_5G316700 [Panicum hallii]